MTWEDIGDCGHGHSPDEQDWKLFCLDLGLAYLKHIAGPLPAGCELGILWHEDEEGSYPTIGLRWQAPCTEAPAEFIHKCDLLLQRFDESIHWEEIDPNHALDVLEDEFGSDEELDDEDEWEYDEEDDDEDDYEDDEGDESGPQRTH